MSGFEIFGWSTLFIVALVVLIFGTLFVATVYGDSLNPLNHPNKVQALSAMLALTLGTAAAIGGAIATIQVANLGLKISQQQEARGSIQFLESRTTHAIENYGELLISLSELYAAGTLLNLSIPVMDNNAQNLEAEGEKRAPEATLAEMTAFTGAVERVQNAIRTITLDEFSRFCLAEQAQALDSKLSYLNQELAKMEFEESVLTLSVENLIGLSVMLGLGKQKFSEGKMGILIEARLKTNSADEEMFNKPYNNRAVRTLFFIGNSLVAISNLSKTPAFIASFGTAIIHDLYYIIPTGETILDCAKKRYGNVVANGAEIRTDFNPSEIIDPGLRFALESANEIGGLYLLSSEMGGQ